MANNPRLLSVDRREREREEPFSKSESSRFIRKIESPPPRSNSFTTNLSIERSLPIFPKLGSPTRAHTRPHRPVLRSAGFPDTVSNYSS